ncbi:fungal-specific transcription factor domain-containing protein [Hygrophoropsis aurantiaca]|uniref:Fungal-specific transcription factor domain-containing protein n=1 Tax=Hygrophoropsis aurantiaca TaxID=72124 RepID=A0ACB8AVC2_9AGAM|nr:fungal-specific transcription factor domain-containing protein [Hygrophoropsis aurantiaca]
MVQLDESLAMTHQSKKKRIEEESVPQDAGTKPIQLQRRRVWRACECCRRKKIKCDGCEPTCSQCQASGSQCTWLQTKDRAALSRHYVQELEARLLHMENLFSQITPVLEQLGPSLNLPGVAGPSSVPGSSGPDSLPAAATVLQAMSSKAGADAHADDMTSPQSSVIKMEDDMSESFGQLALDEHGHMRWIGGSSTMSLIQSFRALTTSPLHRISPMEEDPRAPGPSVNKLYFPASVFFGKIRALPGAEEVEYPDEDLADKLVDAYFTRLHFLMPILDKPSFMIKYKKLMTMRDDVDFIQAQAPFISVVFAVFACAARLVDDPRLTSDASDDGGMGMLYYERALILHYISHPSIQVSHVQSFILMSSFLCSVNCLPQAWLLVGQAVRTAQDLGLHRSPRRLTLLPIEKETRRKIWWSVYCLDRMLALALGRPLGIEDSDCDVELPAEVDDEALPSYFSGGTPPQERPSLMTGTNALTKLYQIAGRVLRQVYAIDNCKDVLEPERKADLQRSVESLDIELTKWCDDLPPRFRNEPTNEREVSIGAILCSHYYSVLITLHRNFLPVRRDQPMPPNSTAKAVTLARSCIRLAPSISDAVPSSHHLAFYIQHLFSSAVIILLYAMHAPDPRTASAAMDEAKKCLTALESWEGRWPGARKCKELLTELTNTADEAIKSAALGERQPPNISMAPPVAPVLLERRRSLASSPTSQSQPPTANRPIKSKPRRVSRSRDPATTRRPPVASPYRVDSQRNRSTSRKRGHDETEGVMTAYQGVFSSPRSIAAKPSPHSSPASDNLPSPSMSTLETHTQEGSPHLSATSPYSYSAPPLSPLHVPSPPRFEYDYGMHHSPLVTSSTHWDVSSGERQGIDMYPSGSPRNPMYSSSYDVQPSSFDSSWYNATSTDLGYGGLSTTPPTSSFSAPGLPFRGLEYIRNYNTNGYTVGGDQDSWWQSVDPSAFGYEPEIPFALDSITPEDHHHENQPSSSQVLH